MDAQGKRRKKWRKGSGGEERKEERKEGKMEGREATRKRGREGERKEIKERRKTETLIPKYFYPEPFQNGQRAKPLEP